MIFVGWRKPKHLNIIRPTLRKKPSPGNMSLKFVPIKQTSKVKVDEKKTWTADQSMAQLGIIQKKTQAQRNSFGESPMKFWGRSRSDFFVLHFCWHNKTTFGYDPNFLQFIQT